MKAATIVLFAAVFVPSTATPVASGRIGIYAIVDSVAFEPAVGPAQRIRMYGAFAYAEQHCYDCAYSGNAAIPNRPMIYSNAYKGFMYFHLPQPSASVTESMIEAVRREWNDIRSVAGTGQAIAFGSWRYAVGISFFRDELHSMPRSAGVNVNGKIVVQIRTDTSVASVVSHMYETNVGIVRLSAASHSEVITLLRSARVGGD